MKNPLLTLMMGLLLPSWLTVMAVSPQPAYSAGLSEPKVSVAPMSSDAWGGTTWGMTIQQVQQLFPSIQPTTPADQGQSQWLLKNFQEASGPVDVYFIFEDNGLSSVEIIQSEG